MVDRRFAATDGHNRSGVAVGPSYRRRVTIDAGTGSGREYWFLRNEESASSTSSPFLRNVKFDVEAVRDGRPDGVAGEELEAEAQHPHA